MQKPQGFSLLEVLISLMLLAMALLGLDAMEVKSLQGVEDTYYFAVAINQLQMMAEKLHALQSRAGLSQQISDWNEINARVLPLGKGEVEGNFPEFTLKIYWGAKGSELCEKNQTGSSGCLSQQLQFSASP